MRLSSNDDVTFVGPTGMGYSQWASTWVLIEYISRRPYFLLIIFLGNVRIYIIFLLIWIVNVLLIYNRKLLKSTRPPCLLPPNSGSIYRKYIIYKYGYFNNSLICKSGIQLSDRRGRVKIKITCTYAGCEENGNVIWVLWNCKMNDRVHKKYACPVR